MAEKKTEIRTGKTTSPLLLFILSLLLASCSGSTRAHKLGIRDGRLTPCPNSPKCVSSSATDGDQIIAPFGLQVPAKQAWEKTKATITALPRTQILSQTSDYLHAESRSAVFGFVDDLELHLRPAERTIAIRSAARLGYYDFGVNRKRVEELREKLRATEVIR